MRRSTRFGRAFAALLAVLALASGSPARASEGDLASLQYLLIWTGDHHGIADGQTSELLAHAVKSFQARAGGDRPDAPLDEAQLRRLTTDAFKASARVDYVQMVDIDIGVVHGLPRKIAGTRTATADAVEWSSGEAFKLTLVRLPPGERSLLREYRALTASLGDKPATVSVFRADHFLLFWYEGDSVMAVRYEERDGEIRGMRVAIAQTEHPTAAAIAAALLHDFAGFAGHARKVLMHAPKLTALREAGKPRETEPAEGRRGVSYGSGFAVSARGHILTNAHVVRRCRTITVEGAKPVRLVAVDEGNDLAILVDGARKSQAFAQFAAEAPALGEEIAVFGYPLRTILADQLNMTTGGISSLAGLGGNPKHLQISAPIQPGNSGGPALDFTGRVLGVVTSKLTEASIARLPDGNQPQAIGFALRSSIAVQFLRRNGVEAKLAPPPKDRLKGAELAAMARSYTMLVTCE